MKVRVSERRRSERYAVSGGVILRRPDGHFIARCDVTNMSEHGLFVVTREDPHVPQEGEVLVEIPLPPGQEQGERLKTTVYRCRIARRQDMGNLMGLGLEFGEKVS